MAMPTFAVADLRERPRLADTVADRVWRAWWKPKGHALAPIAGFMREALGSGPVPSALVAHHAFYRRLGWVAVETEVTEDGLAVFRPG